MMADLHGLAYAEREGRGRQSIEKLDSVMSDL